MSAYADRILGPWRTLIRAATERMNYFALYSAVVNTDNGDETCDLTPEDSRLPSMQSIPKMYGAPGLGSTVPVGSKVLICFQNGDPGRPAIVLFAGSPSGAAIARVGDAVKVTLTSAEVLTLGMLCASPGSILVAPTPLPTHVDVTGTIQAGSSKVKAT